MNEIFSSKRFIAYASQHYIEKGRKYIILGIGVFILLIVVNYLIFISTRNTSTSGLTISLVVGMVLGAIMILAITELSIGDFRRRNNQLMCHMMPASDMEKFVFVITNSFLCWMLYIGIFYLSILILQLLFEAPANIPEIANKLWGDGWIFKNILVALFVLGLSIFSNTITRKNPLLGYLITIGGIASLYILFSLPVWCGLVNDSSGMDFFPYLSVESAMNDSSSSFYVSRIPYRLKPLIEAVLISLTIVITMITGYYKFKEREFK